MKTARLPLEGETRLDGTYAVFPGGKGANQALAAARAGAQVAFVGCVGDDALAQTALESMRSANIDLSHTRTTADAVTGYATVMVSEAGANAIIVASGANQYVYASQVPDAWLSKASTVVIQGEIPMDENRQIALRANGAGARTVLNLAPYATPPSELLDAVDFLILNEVEVSQLAVDFGFADDVRTSARELQKRLGNAVIVTLGADGAIGFSADGDMLRIPAMPVEPVDTTGAGDAFVGSFAAALDDGFGLEVAVRRGVIAGSLACTALGAQSALPNKSQIDDIEKEGNPD
ncbi:MAG: ribokinase [Gammaproteobacteria bacterium]|nr:ribokinase [Gammaproteobacteria bacterium]